MGNCRGVAISLRRRACCSALDLASREYGVGVDTDILRPGADSRV